MKKKKQTIKLGIILIILCIPFFLFLPVVPFLEMDAKTKITLSTISLIIGEVMFWVGGILVGKELLGKYKSYFKPKNWFIKKADQNKDVN
ncbi:hypothetical protein DWB61_06425 [Ancylomarina euxinus]|uniref:Transporter suffix domain-containing protein n=1 Tax=Ancylomarina euxinus TaxID=2283627 RepID=A0A425Y452_9BACT|nr:transporter suffix domain-containing protein [Ancylomarina euxinus]MCZ4694669.1 transporter suffix domain-containing protein [Ancylomarina euxinus]MUP14213.1 transporter suffix domain-containing protein [Ancylomarina euxinus]RRG23065.1 hypothetical protein DWB61_06425 [Ancylomarina euxinus]